MCVQAAAAFKANSASVMMNKTKTDKRGSQAQLVRRLFWLRLLVSDELAGRLVAPPLRNCSLMMIKGGGERKRRGGKRSKITGDVSSPLTDRQASCSLIRLNPLVRASHSSGTNCPNDAWNSQMAKVCSFFFFFQWPHLADGCEYSLKYFFLVEQLVQVVVTDDGDAEKCKIHFIPVKVR